MAHDPDMIDIKQITSTSDNVFNDEGFPFGTRLHLEDDLVEALKAEALTPGDIVRVSGFAVVKSKSVVQEKDETEKSMTLQLTFLKVNREESDAAEQLYGG